MASSAAASCGDVLTGNATTLSVLGADDAGEVSLRYTWSATTLPAGAAAPTFSVNKNHDARTTLATFRAAGTYTLTATITDTAGLSTRSSVNVTVGQTFSGVSLTPRNNSVVLGASQKCAAVAVDQFGRAMTTGAYSFDWAVASHPDGAADPTFSANHNSQAATTTVGFSRAGAYGLSVTATDDGGHAMQAAVSLRVNATPTRVEVASASGWTVDGTTIALAAAGFDQFGAALPLPVKWTWTATTLPSGAAAPTFSSNNSADARNTTVTFRAAGVYQFTAKLTDAAGLTATSVVSVTVNQTFTSVAVSPRSGAIVYGTSQLVSAAALDQFGKAMAGTFRRDWSVATLPDGASTPSFSANNGTQAATTVGFGKAGAYGLAVTVTSDAGRALQAATTLVVYATPTRVDIASASGLTIDGTNIALAAAGFDQFGNALTSLVKVKWAVTTLPGGAPATAFSANNSADARNTTVTFGKAGVYAFTATLTDAGGRTALGATSVTVNQKFSGVAVSPRSGSVVLGTSQQCTATAVDQFGRTMTTGTYTYDWSVASQPDGAADPTFSANHAADARTTIVGFGKAGGYGIAVAATDTQGRTAQSTVTLSVGAALTRVEIASASGWTVNGASVALAATGFDQFGNALASPAKVTWSATSAPSGAASPTFSVNNSADARNTTVAFRKAGSYGLAAKVVDANGRSVQATASVTVVSTLSTVVLDSTQVQLNAGATRQFTARGYDQFGTALATQPSWTWSATGGAINDAGLYTAPADGGTFTVAAQSGEVRGTATVVVASGFLNLQDKALGNLVQSLFADGSISRNDMISILRSVGSDDNVVDAAEFADLKVILNNAAALNMPGYVQVLAGDVVNGNRANAYYQGQSLGNLAAGAAAGQLTRLVDKWFVGADHPTTSYSYRAATGTLFVGGPAYTDTKQGYLGDCYFIAAMGTIAKSSPAAVQNMFVDNGDGTWTVRFYAGGVADYVTVDRYLPTDSWGNLVYQGCGASAASSSTELWLALAEKAYAQWNETGKEGRDGRNAYTSIEGGWMGYVDAQALGRDAGNYWFDASGKQTMINALAANKAVTLGTNSSPGNGLYGNHAYMVVGYNSSNDTFTVVNPWGFAHPGPLNWSQLQSSCQLFTVADTAGSVPISAVRASHWAAADFAQATVDAIHQSASAASWSPRLARSVDALLADCCVA